MQDELEEQEAAAAADEQQTGLPARGVAASLPRHAYDAEEKAEHYGSVPHPAHAGGTSHGLVAPRPAASRPVVVAEDMSAARHYLATSIPASATASAGAPPKAAAPSGAPASARPHALSEPEPALPRHGPVHVIEPRMRTLRWKATQVVIQPGATFSFPIQVAKKGSRLTWCFQTEDMDIDFSVRLLQADGATVHIVPFARFDSHKEPVFATGRVEREGTVMFTWDNSFSWFTPKKLVYSVELTEEVGEEDDEEEEQVDVHDAEDGEEEDDPHHHHTHGHSASRSRSRAAAAARAADAAARRRRALERGVAYSAELAEVKTRAAGAAQESVEAQHALDRAEEAVRRAVREREEAVVALEHCKGRAREAQWAVGSCRQKVGGAVWETLTPAYRRAIVAWAGPVDAMRWEAVSRSMRAVCRSEKMWEALARGAGLDQPAVAGAASEAAAAEEAQGEDDTSRVRSSSLLSTTSSQGQGDPPTWRAAYLGMMHRHASEAAATRSAPAPLDAAEPTATV